MGLNDKSAAQDWYLNKVGEYTDKTGVEEVEITPAIASIILEHFNDKNRILSTNIVEQLASDMKADRFRADNGETIILAKDGSLNDGQHRLSAIVKSGIAQIMTVAFGRSRESRLTVDTGLKRTTGHVLNLMGTSHGTTLAAAARKLESYRNSGTILNVSRVSNARALEVAQDELLNETSAWAHSNTTYFKSLKLPPSEVATLMYLFSEKAPKESLQFFSSLKEGLGLTKNSPIATLRTKLLNTPKLNRGERFELMVRAWNFWIRDEEIARYSIMGKTPDILGPKKSSKSVSE